KYIAKNVLLIRVPFPTDQKLVYRKSGGVSIFTTPFYPTLKIKFDVKGHIYSGKSDSLVIQKYDQSGKMLGKIEGENTFIPLSDSHLDSVAKNKGSNFMKAVNQVGAPSHWPSFQYFLIDDKGRIWVKLMTPSYRQQTWWIFDTDGDPQWKFKLPAEVSLYQVSGDKAYGISNPLRDIPSIIRYEMGIK